MSQFSVCTIMKNEEKNLPGFLEALQGFDVEIVIVDTGSGDRSIEIAEKKGVNVHRYEWKNDFSDARNYAIKLAKKDFIISLDCDEFIKRLDIDELEKMMIDNPDALGLIRFTNYMVADSEKGAYYDWIARIFDRRKFHFEGKIHEQLKPVSGEKNQISGYHAPVEVIHTGYISDSEVSEVKFRRNVKMLRDELKSNPDNKYIHFQLAQELYNHEEYEEAGEHFKEVLDTAILKPGVEFHRLSVIGVTDCLLHLGKHKEALESQKYVEMFGYTPDLHFLMGVVYYLNHDFMNAMQEFVIATNMDNPAKEGTNTYLPLYYIGIINEQFENYNDAKKFYEMCGDYEPAMERLKGIMTGGKNAD
ncbi:glycosyltransferase family 2 protein [Butyrivibrio fibrisolvens]|uniref:tetratricopeptide repeat-containing glycosyltransferase family 2 protein n=1 Tax=Butyrivibrio fibrisolvens TaxID=831 RepID=UPI00040E74D0|nr:glycosyltransferase family 2 protein [Butyrivibrio fibrisolvens]